MDKPFIIYSLFSGSSGNCWYIKAESFEFLIDAGKSAKRIEKELNRLETDMANIKAVFVTHDHSDHISALPKLAEKYNFDIYTSKETAERLIRNGIGDIRITKITEGQAVEIEGAVITPFHTMHDAMGSYCYRLEKESFVCGIATDIGIINEGVRKCLSGAYAVGIECNHDIEMLEEGRYPQFLKSRILSSHGHLSNEDCAAYIASLAENGTKKFLLAHISKENNTVGLALAAAEAALCPYEEIELSAALAEEAVRLL